MRDAESTAVSVPLNQEVWQAWLEKNRRTEKAFHTKLYRFGGAVTISLLAVLLLWLAHWW